jgi:hypothetical protein
MKKLLLFAGLAFAFASITAVVIYPQHAASDCAGGC